MESTQNKIDIVITWVDGNDEKWIRQKQQYIDPKDRQDISSTGDARFRDWDNLQYIFRGIEKYMSWVNKVYLVTWGHLPKWLNTEYEKLVVVKHEDYIPKEYLPTFNSNTIELNYHRIDDLSEQFINFNDDMFVIGETRPEDFFENGQPKDMAVISPPPQFRDVACCFEANNFGVISDYFSNRDINKNKKKWYSLKYGKYLIRTMIFSRFNSFIGFFEPHVPFPHLKSTISEVWDKEYDVLDRTCKNKFRARDNVDEWLFRHWQIMSGNFEPRSWKFGKLLDIGTQEEEIVKILSKKSGTKLVCLNDSSRVVDFDKSKELINSLLNKKFPEKSKFEK